MNLGLLLRIIRARFGLISLIFIVTVASTAVASFLMPRIYAPSTMVFIDVKSLDPVLGGAVHTPQSVRGLMATQVEIIKSDRVMLAMIRDLGLDRDPEIVESWMKETGGNGDVGGWLAKRMLRMLSITPSNEGSTLSITYESRDPVMATDVVNSLARNYVQATRSLRAEPARESAGYFEQQVATNRERLKLAEARLSAFQQSSGIVATDERVDIENQRLQELSTQLVAIQTQASESRSRRDAVNRDGRDSMPEVVQNQLVQNLKAELGRAEARLQELSSRLGINHPQYQSALSEVQVLRGRLNGEIDKVTRSIVATSRINTQREAEIRASLEEQRARVLRLRKDHDQLAALRREVDDARKSLELVTQRLTQTTIESQVPQSNVSILSPALVPADPARPKPVLNIVVGGFVGLLLGMIAALSLEAFRRPVRTAEDLLRAVELPVLAVLPPANARRAQRLIGDTGPAVAQPQLRLGN
jgi:polysaccharide biosynthesis transport protein